MTDLASILAASPTAATVQPKPKAPLPEQIKALLLAPPPGGDPGAAFDAFAISYDIPTDVVRQICDTAPEGYTPETIERLRGLLPAAPAPEPETAPEVKPDPQPVKPAPAAAPKRTRRSAKKQKDGDALNREERMALACAALRASLTSLEGACAFVTGSAQG